MILGRTVNYRTDIRNVLAKRGRPIWTPAALFAQGQQGAWYEPRPEYLYQDAAGTVPVTADGDPAGRNDDLSPNGNNATQTTSADRPLYVTDGTLNWLAHDGTGDTLATAANINANMPEFWFFFAGRHSGGGSVMTSLSETPSGDFQYVRIDFDQIFIRAESSTSNQVTIPIAGTVSNAVYSVRLRESDRTVTVWKNGVQVGQQIISGTAWFPEMFQLNTAGGKNGVGAAATLGYGYILVLDALDAETQDKVESHLAKLAGITL